MKGLRYFGVLFALFLSVSVMAQCGTMGCFNRPQLYGYVQSLQHQNQQLSQQLTTLKAQSSAASNLTNLVTRWSHDLHVWLAFDQPMLQKVWRIQTGLGGMSGVLIVLASLIFWCFLIWTMVGSRLLDARSGSSRPTSDASTYDSGADPDEFDYLASTEAVPAKLDLARAYLQMEDFDSAKKVLKEIIAQGNVQQRDYAQRLYEQMQRT